jgi:hypothetical protein
MSPITHFLSGWAVANMSTMNKRERVLVTLAAVVPDVDGIGILWDLFLKGGGVEFYQKFHHSFGHNVFFGITFACLAFLPGLPKGKIVSLMVLSFHLHLVGDYVGARGIGEDYWPVTYLWPLTDTGYYWRLQWPLNGWQNVVITGILLVLAFYWAWWRGYSPIEMVSGQADNGLVRVLRKRFGEPGGSLNI